MEGIRCEQSIAELCHKYGIPDSTYYKWNKEFIEAGKARLDGDIAREVTSDEVKELRQENIRLKEVRADLVVRYDIVKNLKLGLMVKCTPERGHNALFFIPLQVFIML